MISMELPLTNSVIRFICGVSKQKVSEMLNFAPLL